MILILAIVITGNKVFELGETSGIRCYTPVQVQAIRWLDEANGLVRQAQASSQLVLDLIIGASHNDSSFTCEVSDGGFVESQTISITTGGIIQ